MARMEGFCAKAGNPFKCLAVGRLFRVIQLVQKLAVIKRIARKERFRFHIPKPDRPWRMPRQVQDLIGGVAKVNDVSLVEITRERRGGDMKILAVEIGVPPLSGPV